MTRARNLPRALGGLRARRRQERQQAVKSIDDLTVTGRRVLVRLDLNVPMSGDTISDDGKIRACLPTLTALLERGAAVIACSHLGQAWPP